MKAAVFHPMLLYLALLSVVLGSCSARELSTRSGLQEDTNLADSSLNVKVTVDVSKTHPVAPNLWGIFFEEVGVASRSLCHDERRHTLFVTEPHAMLTAGQSHVNSMFTFSCQIKGKPCCRFSMLERAAFMLS